MDTPLGAFQDQFYNFVSLLGEIGRQLIYKAPQAAAISPFFISPTHPPPTLTGRDRPPHRELRPLLFSTSAWVL